MRLGRRDPMFDFDDLDEAEDCGRAKSQVKKQTFNLAGVHRHAADPLGAYGKFQKINCMVL